MGRYRDELWSPKASIPGLAGKAMMLRRSSTRVTGAVGLHAQVSNYSHGRAGR